MRLRISIRGRVRPSVGPSVRRSVPSYSRTTNLTIFEGRKSSNDITNNDTMSDDVVASYVPPRYLLKIVTHATVPITCNAGLPPCRPRAELTPAPHLLSQPRPGFLEREYLRACPKNLSPPPHPSPTNLVFLEQEFEV